MAIETSEFILWSELKPSLVQLLNQHTKFQEQLQTLPPPSPQFSDFQTALAQTKKNLHQAQHTITRPTYYQQEIITNAQTALDDLLETNHKLFLHYHHQHETITNLINQWPTEQNGQQKHTLFEQLTTASQSYLNNHFFNRSLLPYNYPENQQYTELAYLAQNNNKLLEEYSTLTAPQQLTSFVQTLQPEHLSRQKHRNQLVQDFHLNSSKPESQIITELTTNFIEKIQSELNEILENPSYYHATKLHLKEHTEKIKYMTAQILNTPSQLTEQYLSFLCSKASEEKISKIPTLIYFQKEHIAYDTQKDKLETARNEKKQEVMTQILHRTKDISIMIETIPSSEINRYYQELKQLQQYCGYVQNEQLKDTLTQLEQKIDRYLRFYNSTTISSPIPQPEQHYHTPNTEKYKPKKTSSLNQFPLIKNAADLLDFAYETAQQITHKELRNFLIYLSGYDGKRYNPIPLSTRLQHAKSYQFQELTNNDKKIYDHIMQNLRDINI